MELTGQLSATASLSVTSAMPRLIEAHQARLMSSVPLLGAPHIVSGSQLFPPSVSQASGPVTVPPPDVVLAASVVNLGARTSEGLIVMCITPAWNEIINQLARDPEWLFKIPPRKLEEVIAGAYERDGFPNVILTPRSGDDGRDIIAERPGHCSVRVLDQIKAYKETHVVTADEVRSMLGVLALEQNASKALITTTSRFAPGIAGNARIQARVPYSIELVDGEKLLNWLLPLAPQRRDR